MAISMAVLGACVITERAEEGGRLNEVGVSDRMNDDFALKTIRIQEYSWTRAKVSLLELTF